VRGGRRAALARPRLARPVVRAVEVLLEEREVADRARADRCGSSRVLGALRLQQQRGLLERRALRVLERRRAASRPPFASSDSPKARYIIPPMSGIPPPPAPAFSGASATIASVVRMFFAIEAAFCSAERVTIVGSPMPDLSRSST